MAADHVVIAAGPASGRVAALAGIPLPIEPRKRTVFMIRAPLDGSNMPLVFDTSGMWIRPEGDGFICGISPSADTDHDPNGDFDPDLDLLEDPLWPLLAHRIPALEQLRLQRAWAGHYDMCLLDHNAVIGPFPDIPNLIVASGFSGHGVQHGPATGRAVAELIRFGGYRTLDLTPFGYERVRDNRRCRRAWCTDVTRSTGSTTGTGRSAKWRVLCVASVAWLAMTMPAIIVSRRSPVRPVRFRSAISSAAAFAAAVSNAAIRCSIFFDTSRSNCLKQTA